MCKVGKIILKVFAILAAIAGVVAAVYYWNLDQKLLDWFYKKTEWFKSLRARGEDMADYADVDVASGDLLNNNKKTSVSFCSRMFFIGCIAITCPCSSEQRPQQRSPPASSRYPRRSDSERRPQT